MSQFVVDLWMTLRAVPASVYLMVPVAYCTFYLDTICHEMGHAIVACAVGAPPTKILINGRSYRTVRRSRWFDPVGQPSWSRGLVHPNSRTICDINDECGPA